MTFAETLLKRLGWAPPLTTSSPFGLYTSKPTLRSTIGSSGVTCMFSVNTELSPGYVNSKPTVPPFGVRWPLLVFASAAAGAVVAGVVAAGAGTAAGAGAGAGIGCWGTPLSERAK